MRDIVQFGMKGGMVDEARRFLIMINDPWIKEKGHRSREEERDEAWSNATLAREAAHEARDFLQHRGITSLDMSTMGESIPTLREAFKDAYGYARMGRNRTGTMKDAEATRRIG